MFAKRTVISLCCCILWVCFSSCSLRAIKEAEAVVAQADSLWRNGQRYEDSVSLAEAYNTLHQSPITNHQSPITNHHSTSYAHACYHYGRLLRDHDDPVAAMQVFINASHSRTHDYHILGRVYSNMGSICHLANEFQLSYDMYSRSANMFLRNGDTLAYYYLHNDMALEMAEIGDAKQTYALLKKIRGCPYPELHYKSLEAEALLHQTIKDYEKVIALIDSLQLHNCINAFDYMMKARAFYYTNQRDSALLYAQKVVSNTPNDNTAISAYYILLHDSDTLTTDSLLSLFSARSDVQKAWAYSHGKFTQAVQLLEQDLARIPDNLRILIIVSILLVFFTVLFIVFRVIHHKRQQIQQDLHLQQEHHQLLLQQQSDYLQKRVSDLEISCAALRNSSNIKTELDWNNYDSMCAIANSRLCGIVDRLHAYPKITDNDVRFCILVLLEFSYDDIANILNISPKSISKLKSISAQRLGTTMKDLRKKLIQIVCQNNEI